MDRTSLGGQLFNALAANVCHIEIPIPVDAYPVGRVRLAGAGVPAADEFALQVQDVDGPGPAVGEIMTILLERRIEDGPYSKTEAYDIARAWALEKGMPDPGEPPPVEEE